MIISLLPTTALAAEENDVWSKEYGTIRVYLDSDTEEDYNKLGGDHIRIMSEKYLAKDGDDKGMRACWRIFTEYWFTTNARGIKAKDIDSVVLAKNKIGKPSDKISIPIKGDTTYKVEVSQGHYKGVTSIDSYDYLRIYISKRELHTVEYKFSGIRRGLSYVCYPASFGTGNCDYRGHASYRDNTDNWHTEWKGRHLDVQRLDTAGWRYFHG